MRLSSAADSPAAAPDGEVALTIEGVTRRFGTLVAVDAFDLQVRRGEVIGLLGHNGAGKTTLIRLVNGLLQPDQGTITVFGMDPIRDGAAVRSRAGVLTTYPALEEWLSPRENLQIHASVHGVPEDVAHARIRDLLERFELDPDDTGPSRGLSAGQKQRVAMARALVHDPDLLLLDEPTANLDPIAVRGMRDLIRGLSRERGRTVVMSTHNLEEAAAICDRVAIMREGRLLAIGTTAQLAADLGSASGVGIDVAPGQQAAALAALGERARAEGDARVTVTATAEDVPGLVRTLVAAGIDVHGVALRAMDLEDVYVRLHENLGPVRRTAKALR